MTGPTGPKIIIIGAGIVGASLADELTGRDWTDVTVLDGGRLPATGGSTSHAPGVVFQTNAAKVMSEFARHTVAKLGSLSWQGEPCYLPVGGLEIATTPERVAELQRRLGYARSWGIEGARLLDAEETVKTWDLLDPATVLGGLYVPDDGVAKAVRAVAAQLDRATERGARVIGECEVTGITSTGGRVTGVTSTRADHPADLVVCCAGIWGPKISAMVDLTLPLTPLAHQFAWTGPLEPLAGHTAEATRPVLRHQDHDLYYRERGTGLGIGYYGHRPMPVRAQDLAPWPASPEQVDALGTAPVEGSDTPMPSVLPFTADDFAPALAESARILPCTADAVLDQAINGVFSFTPDNLPVLGPHPGLDGFWVAEAVWITHSAGVAAAMADWLVDGHSRFDLHGCELSRFEPHMTTPAFLEARDCQNFVEVYDIVHPLQPMTDPDEADRVGATTLRPVRTSPFYLRQRELGAFFLEANGWERPHWYEANAGLLDSDRNTGWACPRFDPHDPAEAWAARYWSPVAAAEAAVTRTDVAVYDMTALKRLEVSGPGATAFLQTAVTGNVAKSVGSVTYCLLLDHAGRVRSDVTVARLGPDRFQVGANGEADRAWLESLLPAGSAVQLRDVTPGTCCLGVWGPKAREVVQTLTDADLSHTGLKYFRSTRTALGTVPVTIMRLSYVGELGFEIYADADHGLALWDLVMAAGEGHGIIAAGRSAFNALRIEKGYRSYGTDLTAEHTPAEAGLEFAVKIDSGDFVGRDSLLKQGSPARRLTALRVDHPTGVVLGNEPVFGGGGAGDVDAGAEEAVGYVTSAAYAYSLGFPLAYAWLPTPLAEPGTEVRIGYFDRLYPATVIAEPAFDPEMTRIRR